MSINKTTHIHWFNNDLRLHDQPFISQLNGKTQHFGVYIVDPRKYVRLKAGFRKTGKHRLQWLRQHLVDLQQNYRKLGSDLLIVKGYPELLIPQIAKKYDASISFQNEYATEERKIQEAVCLELPADSIYRYDGHFLVQPQQIPIDTFPKSFSGFKKKAEQILKSLNTSSLAFPEHLPPAAEKFKTLHAREYSMHRNSVVPFEGGQTTGLRRLNNYLFETQQIDSYKSKRNRLLGIDYSSKFSPWLATGGLSPRLILDEIRRYEQSHGSNESTYWLVFELLWRDYFRHAGKHYKDQLFHQGGLLGLRNKPLNDTISFHKWCTGNTENQFVNANMKELSSTGFMSNRGRQNVASYLIHDLNLDWRLGAAWFEQHLLDYDVYSNQGNWLYIAGLAFNPKGPAVFDLTFQVNHYDPAGTYQKQWTNEKIS
jgi:deoxyribodipyrimidine photo-lyase